eukprot:gene42538-57589_t
MASIIVAFSWKYVGYNFIFFLAAFQAIPRSLIEAAAMDGSGVVRRFWDIQLPLITPTIFFLLVINITESFQDSFGIVDIMTSGGPANATNLMVYKIYSDGFKGLDYSGAAASASSSGACITGEGDMVERTPFLNFFTHLILFIGFVFCIAPFLIVAIAASHNLKDVNDVPMSLLPGSDFW